MRMSHASASENPAPAAGPFTAATTGYGIRRRSTIAWCRTSAPRRTSEGRSTSPSSTPLRNQVTSPPAQKACPAPVTISPRSGARSASQANATVNSPISSGLIALKASGRSRVSVPISPSISIRIVFSCGGVTVWLVISPPVGPSWRPGGPSGQQPPLSSMAEGDRKERQEGALTRAERIAQQRKSLPDQPAVYLFYDGGGELLYVGKARSIRKRISSLFSGGDTRLTSRIDRIESLVTANEAEALLTEQSFIKRHRPRFNIRLRDDKSYPYVAVSLDEDYPRVYFTREKHRSGRAYFGPFSSAKRVRETLDLLGKLFQFRTCEGPEPGRRSGSPCLDYYIKRCGAPCVEYISQEEYRHNIEAIVDFLSGRYRQVEREEEG